MSKLLYIVVFISSILISILPLKSITPFRVFIMEVFAS